MTMSAHATRRAIARRGAAGSLLVQALAPVQPGLDAVTDRILFQLTDPVARSVVYLITAGGKRLRPALVLLAGAVGPAPNRPALIDTATAVELIHTATLIHDDIIDRSPLRRAQPTFHARWGTERAVLMGDYLYATAFTLLARLDAPEVMRIMADVCQELCRGELREVEARYRLDLTEADYLQIIQDKTASLIGGCCRSGAVLGGCPPEVIERLTEFGLRFGLAFQIIDDCLDLSGDQRELGKSILSDLDKGALSLPIIYLTQRLSGRERDRLFAPLKERATDPAFLARVARAAKTSGALAQARARAGQLMAEARQALAGLPMNGLLGAYTHLAEYAVTRRS
jgi:geranylgeranyl pyrophosphate synthase